MLNDQVCYVAFCPFIETVEMMCWGPVNGFSICNLKAEWNVFRINIWYVLISLEMQRRITFWCASSHRSVVFIPLSGSKYPAHINSLRPRVNIRPFADDIFKCIFLNENESILLRISLKFIPKFRINNIPALVQIMAWRRPGDKPLSEPMLVSLPTHICVTRPQ